MGLFDSESSVSSKRFVTILLVLWGLGFGGFYIFMQQFGGKESLSTVSLIEFALGSAVSIGVLGTVGEGVKNKMSNFFNKKEDEE